METSIIAVNVRRARLAKGLSQGKVAEVAGISRPAYRNIESGASVPRVDTLQSIARALGVKLQDLVTPVKSLSAVRFRAQKKITSREQILVEVARWLEGFEELEGLVGDKAPYLFEELAKRLHGDSDAGRAIRAAGEARRVLGLSDGEPIRDICGLLESGGVKIYPISHASEGFFGLSVGQDDGGPAVVVNVWDRISVERWIFSAAQELGHLLLHLDAYDVRQAAEDIREEAEANEFASHFLMPQCAFEKEWGEAVGLPIVDRVLKVKRIFKVSYKTVLYRLTEDGRVSNDIWKRFNAAYKSRTGRSLGNKDEPLPVAANDFRASTPEPHRAHEPDGLSAFDFVEDRLSRLVRLAIEQGKITMARGAEILGLSLDAMRERVASWTEG